MTQPPPPPPPPPGQQPPYVQPYPTPPKKRGKALWIVLGVVGAVIILCCGGGVIVGLLSDDDDSSNDSSSSSSETSGPAEADTDASDTEEPESDTPTPEPECEAVALKKAELRGIADGARRGVDVIVGFKAEVDEEQEFSVDTAYAVRVKSAGETSEVVLAGPAKLGDGLLIATEPALEYFRWGDLAVDGSPVAEARDYVEDSDAAADALACL